MIFGVDVSHYQRNTPELRDCNFIIIKASEGINYKDPRMEYHVNNAYNMNCNRIGFYHYARAEKNDPFKEADHFFNCIKDVIHLADLQTVIALDVEDKSFYNEDIDNWSYKFMLRINRLTGKQCMLYVQKSKLKEFKKTSTIAPLWLAMWPKQLLDVKAPQGVEPFTDVAMWQYRGNPLDLDICYKDWNELARTVSNGTNENERKRKELNVLNGIITGMYGVGQTRKILVENEGLDYSKMQGMVNDYYNVAKRCINGDYGNGDIRITELTKDGYDPKIVQTIINKLLR